MTSSTHDVTSMNGSFIDLASPGRDDSGHHDGPFHRKFDRHGPAKFWDRWFIHHAVDADGRCRHRCAGADFSLRSRLLVSGNCDRDVLLG